ncbi:DUF4097 family beta strand repeat-containing protein [Nocardioides sp. YIM 152588]|uniref:DUF4097 family beta strand repeat-containing protein n=1 Tax=Nocardioides sp. YIM 152588 TaxID=3158259 RepID=UPI0032E4FF22
MNEHDQHDGRHAEYGFDTPGPIEVVVDAREGAVTIHAAETDVTTVHIDGRRAGEVEVERTGSGLRVAAPRSLAGFLAGDQRLEIDLRVPLGSSLVVRTGSATVTASGPLAAASVKSGSGDVGVEQVTGPAVVATGSGGVRLGVVGGELKVRSGSGRIDVGETGGTASVSTGSGDVRLGRTTRQVAVKTGSGDVEIGEAEGDVVTTTGSGDTLIRTARRGHVTSKCASGDIRIGVPDGTPVWTDITTVSGRVASGLRGVGEPEPGAEHVEVRAVTVSGDVVLAPA